MRKICIILLLNNLFIHTLGSQTLFQQIENAYNALDSVAYIESIILSFKEEDEKRSKESYEFSLRFRLIDFNNTDSIQRQNIIDSIHKEYLIDTKIWREEKVNQFSDRIRAKTPVYVLNLILKDGKTLQVDTERLAFNLFCFDKNYKGSLYVYCKDGQYSGDDARYRTFSQQLSKNAPKVFKKIMQKRPKYLLYCHGLEGMNTILYVLNDTIYVYRIAQMEEYELNEYLSKFHLR